jgi:Xaa-Pro aminopeptidase
MASKNTLNRPWPGEDILDLSRRDLYFTPDFSAEELLKRRKKVARKIGRKAHAFIPSAPPTAGANKAQDAPFYYLSGLDTYHTYLLIEGSSGKSTLFIPDAKSACGEEPENSVGIEQASMIKKRLLLDEVKPISQLKKRLSMVENLFLPMAGIEGGRSSRFEATVNELNRQAHPWDQAEPRSDRFKRLIRDLNAKVAFSDLCPVLEEMRRIKSPAEIELMRKAGRLSAKAVLESIKATQPGTTEMKLHAISDYVFRQFGGSGPSYSTIAASGKDTWYGHYSKNNNTLRSGEAVLMDTAADLRHYSSDIARFWPVNGTYTPWQRKTYGMITEYHKILLSLICPGKMHADIYSEAAKLMKKKVRQAGFPYSGTAAMVDQMIKRDVKYLNHGIGMSTHDAVGPWRDMPLKPGMVFALDPMIWLKDKHYYVRVEDTVLVTRHGYEVLTRDVPFEPQDIEALMKEPSNFPI